MATPTKFRPSSPGLSPQHVQVGPEELDALLTLHAGERFVDVVLDGRGKFVRPENR
jgi:hypothetical protein